MQKRPSGRADIARLFIALVILKKFQGIPGVWMRALKAPLPSLLYILIHFIYNRYNIANVIIQISFYSHLLCVEALFAYDIIFILLLESGGVCKYGFAKNGG
jgi:hypothetical protein